MLDQNIFVCADCKNQLDIQENVCLCGSCGRKWNLSHNIPQFSDTELFYSVFEPEIADKVVEMAETESWSKAIETYSHTLGEYTARYITDMSRADWMSILPLTKESVVLDIGSGWGNIGINLSARCKQVYCGDVNFSNLRLLKARLKEEAVDNIELFAYDANSFLRLPFEDSSVDIVVLNGVLEWMGSNDHPASADRVQLEALKEIRRVMKSGGMLYCGIENRYSLSTLRGVGLHGEIPFVGLFPRWFSNAVTRLVKGERHRTYIYSIYGYKKLMKNAGFSSIDFYWPYPSYHNPNFLFPLKPSWVKKYWLEDLLVSRSTKLRITKMLGLSRLPFHWLAFSYSIRCWK